MTLEQLEEKAKQLNEQIQAFKRQLEAQKPKEKQYTWEECFKGCGYYLDSGCMISETTLTKPDEYDKNVAITEKVLKSHLAACQLSHIIEAINKDFEQGVSVAISANKAFNCGFQISDYIVWSLPRLNSTDAGLKLIETNTPLLLQYFGVEEN